MNAIQLLREMHADTKVRFKVILGTADPVAAASQWQALQPDLDLHERLEDQFLYTPFFEEMGPGSPLGDWGIQHDADVAVVQQLIAATRQLDPQTPEWRMSVARVMDTLTKHVMDEEGQIFGRIEQAWSRDRLEAAGTSMQTMKDKAVRGSKAVAARVKPTSTRTAAKAAPTRRRR
jgi:hypothetical protein